MSHLFYLVGPPGSGKRTVGKELSKLTGAALLDNHIANDPIFTAYGVKKGVAVHPEVWRLIGVVRGAVRQAALQAPAGMSHIFTNYLAKGDAQVLQDFRALARARASVFVPVWLSCPPSELERRMGLPERHERLKISDAAQLRGVLAQHGLLAPPPDAIQVDTASLPPRDVAFLIAAHAGALF